MTKQITQPVPYPHHCKLVQLEPFIKGQKSVCTYLYSTQ